MKTATILAIAFLLFPVSATTYADVPKMHGVIVTKSKTDVDDVLIKTRIQTAYSLNPVINHFNLDVNIQNGVVSIKGALQNDVQKELALAIARADLGSLDVLDNIKVDPRTKAGEIPNSFGQKVKDATLTSLVKSRLALNSVTKNSKIKVATINNVTTLEGDVATLAAKDTADRIAIKTLGVSTVKNYLTVNGK